MVVLVYAIMIVSVVARIKKKKKDASESAGSNKGLGNVGAMIKAANGGNTVMQGRTISNSRRNKSAGVNKHMAREKMNIRGWEDRNGDWLARQMDDERQAQRKVSEMFQLKMQHRNNCEAEMLKQFHESHCDADSVDTAET